jgi:hypothetical protein
MGMVWCERGVRRSGKKSWQAARSVADGDDGTI